MLHKAIRFSREPDQKERDQMCVYLSSPTPLQHGNLYIICFKYWSLCLTSHLKKVDSAAKKTLKNSMLRRSAPGCGGILLEKWKKSDYNSRAKSLVNRNIENVSDQSSNMKREGGVCVGSLPSDFIRVGVYITYPNWNTFENEVGFMQIYWLGPKA